VIKHRKSRYKLRFIKNLIIINFDKNVMDKVFFLFL
jgi:hypothetical protein